jgi:outer membrane biosynthesis protein TonB
VITAAEDPRRERRFLWAAIVISALVHLLIFLIYFRGAELLAKAHFRIPVPLATPKEEVVMLSSALTLSKKAHIAPVAKPRPQKPQPQSPESPPNPETLPQTLTAPSFPEPSKMLHELSKNAPTAPPNKPKTQKEKRVTQTPTAPPTTSPRKDQRVAYLRPPQLPRHASQPSHLSQEQLQQIQSDMAHEIAIVRNNTNPLRVAPATPSAPKRYGIQMNGVAGDLRGYEGVCEPNGPSFPHDGQNYYYVICNVQTMAGGLERQAMPWPIHYPPNRDPFNGSMGWQQVRDMPVPGPDPGWKLPSGKATTPEMIDYAKRHGVNILSGSP